MTRGVADGLPVEPSGALSGLDFPVTTEAAGRSTPRLVIAEGAVLLVEGELPTEAPAGAETGLVVAASDTSVWLAHAAPEPDSELGEWVPLRSLYGQISERDWVLAGRAAQLLTWADTHRYCGRCGTETEALTSERGRRCPSCELVAYPRLSPAVIMLIEDDDGRALLGWGRQFPGRFFSTLAGFVEPGETLEDAVRREVFEEVGVRVGAVDYFGSQPWPFPHSIMLGFVGRALTTELDIDPAEIVEAGWYEPDDLPPVPRGGMSIAGRLIDDWIRRRS